MSWHIVIALQGMLVIRFSFADYVVENALQIGTHVGVGILVDRECGRGVFDNEVVLAGLW